MRSFNREDLQRRPAPVPKFPRLRWLILEHATVSKALLSSFVRTFDSIEHLVYHLDPDMLWGIPRWPYLRTIALPGWQADATTLAELWGKYVWRSRLKGYSYLKSAEYTLKRWWWSRTTGILRMHICLKNSGHHLKPY